MMFQERCRNNRHVGIQGKNYGRQGIGEDIGEFHQLSLHSIGGFTTRKSLKLWGKIKNKKVIVLIDCGATHNFISLMLVEELRLEVTPTCPYSIEVGDGHKVRCQGVCRSLPIELQDLQFT